MNSSVLIFNASDAIDRFARDHGPKRIQAQIDLGMHLVPGRRNVTTTMDGTAVALLVAVFP